MHRHRVLVAFGIAWLSALALSWWVYQRSTTTQSRQAVLAVAAAQDLPVGKRLTAADLKLVTLDRKDLPQGAYFSIAEVVDRAVTAPVAASELVLERKLAAKGSGEGMTALIEPGMRAVSVQVNEISGVAGFVQPGTRVDVLFTRIFSSGDAATTTILENVKVIAYGRQLEPGANADSRENTRPTVATLLVTQEQAAKLALAMQRGRIQLTLRNPLDSAEFGDTEPIESADLGIREPVRNASRNQSVPAASGDTGSEVGQAASGDRQPRGKPANNGRVVVRVYRGSEMTEESVE